MEQIDREFHEIWELEEQASKAQTQEECLEHVIEAARLCSRYGKTWLDPLGRIELASKARRLLSKALAIKDAKDEWKADAFDLTAITDALPTSQTYQEPESSRTLNRSEKILVLKASNIGGKMFKPWQEKVDLIALERSAKPPNDLLSLSQEHLAHFQSWSRAEDAIPPPSLVFERENVKPVMSTSKPLDLIQDVGADCSVVASICALMTRPEIGQQILSKAMFPYDNDKRCPVLSPSGRYWLRFYFNGSYRVVEIDDLLPVSNSERILHIIDRNNPSLLWPALIEKAYLHIWGGYDFLGSNSNTDLFIMTGWIPELIILSEAHLEDCLWAKMMRGLKTGTVLVTLGTSNLGKDVELEFGLVSNHNYAVLDLKVEDNIAYVLIKNPWREPTIWQTIGDESMKSTSKSKRQQMLNPGTFWIPYMEIFKYFHWGYLNWNPGLFEFRNDIHFTWKIPRLSAMKVSMNTPQFSITSTQKRKVTLVWLLLSRHFQDGAVASTPSSKASNDQSGQGRIESASKHTSEPNFALGDINIFIYEANGNKVYQRGRHRLTKGRYVDAMHTLLRFTLPPETTYTIVPRQEGASIGDHNFTMTAYSNFGVLLGPARDTHPYSTTIESEWWSREAAGNINAPNFGINPQYTLEVKEPTHLAVSLESWNINYKVNVMLYHDQKDRVYSVKKHGIALGGTEYDLGYSIIQTKDYQPLEPGTYTILSSTFEPEQESKFTIQIESSSPVTTKKLPDERFDGGNHEQSLPLAQFAGNVNCISIPINPLHGMFLRVIVTFDSSYYPGQSIETGRSSSGRRTPLKICLEKGYGPNRQVVAQTNYGEYADASPQGLRLLDIMLDPKRYQNNLFLVLERAAGCGVAGSEERYKVMVIFKGTAGPESLQVAKTWNLWGDSIP